MIKIFKCPFIWLLPFKVFFSKFVHLVCLLQKIFSLWNSCINFNQTWAFTCILYFISCTSRNIATMAKMEYRGEMHFICFWRKYGRYEEHSIAILSHSLTYILKRKNNHWWRIYTTNYRWAIQVLVTVTD